MTTSIAIFQNEQEVTTSFEPGDLYVCHVSPEQYYVVLVGNCSDLIEDDETFFGTVIASNSNFYTIGETSSTWYKQSFDRFFGTVIMKG